MSKGGIHYYKVTVPAGKTFKADFVGRPLTYSLQGWGIESWTDFWEITVLDANGNPLNTVRTDAFNPRRTATYTNSSTSPVVMYAKVSQTMFSGSKDDHSAVRRYALAFKYE